MAGDNMITRIARSPALSTARRALGLGKYYVFISLVTGLGVLFFIIPACVNPGTGALPLLAIPFTVSPMVMLVTPIAILFVYDKNNGVLEYLLSLGMTQRDIYLRYLNASLIVAFAYLAAFFALNAGYLYALFGAAHLQELLTVFSIGFAISVSTVMFVITLMMEFSSLQKPRAGANQPLAITLGLVGVAPGYFIPFAFPFSTAIAVEILQAAIIAAVALVLMALSGRLIQREKFLP